MTDAQFLAIEWTHNYGALSGFDPVLYLLVEVRRLRAAAGRPLPPPLDYETRGVAS